MVQLGPAGVRLKPFSGKAGRDSEALRIRMNCRGCVPRPEGEKIHCAGRGFQFAGFRQPDDEPGSASAWVRRGSSVRLCKGVADAAPRAGPTGPPAG